MLLREDPSSAVADLLALAIQEDPLFSSALALKTWMTQSTISIEEKHQALSELAGLTFPLLTEEQLFIDAVKLQLSGDLKRAEDTYRLLLEVDDTNFMATRTILELCLARTTTDSCVQEHVQHARLRVKDFEANYHAALALLSNKGDTPQSTIYAERALSALKRPGSSSISPESIANTLSFPMISAWNRGDVNSALAHSRELRTTMNDYPLPVRHELQPRLVNFALMLGRVNESKMIGEAILDPDQQFEAVAGALFAAGDMSNLKLHLSADRRTSSSSIALFLSMTGLINADNASQVNSISDPQWAVIRAMMDSREALINSVNLWPTACPAIKARFCRHNGLRQGSATRSAGQAVGPKGRRLKRTSAVLCFLPRTGPLAAKHALRLCASGGAEIH